VSLSESKLLALPSCPPVVHRSSAQDHRGQPTHDFRYIAKRKRLYVIGHQAVEKTSFQSFAILITVHPSVFARSSARSAPAV
jgi:hypothetical protein